MKKTLLTLSLSGIFLISGLGLSAQSNTPETKAEKKELKEKAEAQKKQQREAKRKLAQARQGIENISRIETLNFSFYPNTVEPEFGLPIDLDGLYYFTVDKNVIEMDLPYVGRFYVTPYDPENIPLNITSSKFVYLVHTNDEVTFDVAIFPSDLVSILNQGIKFEFTLNKTTGSATLKVTADNRQEVTYTGTFN